jgi:hypothetical protein
MLKPNHPSRLVQRVVFLLLLLAIVSCETLGSKNKIQENLDKSIELFNFEFESKSFDSITRFIHPTHRANYMANSLEMTKRVTFFEATTLDIQFFKDEIPALITSKGPEEGFNRTVVTVRYQVAVLPSTKLKTLIIEQEWVLLGEQWVVIPNLNKLLK